MEKNIISNGNSLLSMEFLDDHYIPVLYFDNGDEKQKVLDGLDFIKIIINEKVYNGKIKSVSLKDNISFNGNFENIDNIQFSGSITPIGDLAPRFEWTVKIKNNSEEIIDFRTEINFKINDTGIPRWMIPGMFYKHNGSEKCVRKYPRFSINEYNPVEFVSNNWAFRSDRSSCPSIFCWTDNFTSCLATNETFSDGISGIGFKSDEESTELMLNYPYIETPSAYSFHFPNASNPQYRTASLIYGGEMIFGFSSYVEERDIHLYDSLIRDIYFDSSDEPNPWMSKSESSALAAYGLYNWHFDHKNNILNETCAFDSYFGKGYNQVDRPHMHVSCFSGVPYAFALWKYGNIVRNKDYVDAGLSVINRVAEEGISPSGFFYGEWTSENGWGTGWNPDKKWIQSRTIGDAVWFMIQALDHAKQLGIAMPKWESAIISNLNSALKIQRADGNMGSYYDVDTGDVHEWDGAAGIVWITVFAAAYKYFNDDKYKIAAMKCGEYYSKFVEDEYIYGAPEDIHLSPSSEDGYNGTIAYVNLYELFNDEKWLELAETAADWMLSFRLIYNTKFPEATILNKYDFRTIGADIASPVNNHLHSYGLMCHRELIKLWEYTGDTYYLSRAADNLACFHQFIARNDGDFNARIGMITEQWYHTDWNHPKGSMLQLAHAWCAGAILYANLCTSEIGDLIIDGDNREVYLLDNHVIKDTEYLDPDLIVTLVNSSYTEQHLKVRHSKLGIVGNIILKPFEESRILIGGMNKKIEYLEDENWTD